AVTSVGWALPISDQVKRLASLTQQCGLDGVVCSPLEIAIVREACGPAFLTMVPGIRPADASTGDQKRVMTPKDAVAAGVHHMVIGRPITGAADPAKAAADILASL
ncbi:MAG: orotidine 5'-phosphate decarboxylase, partial [Alphaproteobacteria bacterium]|nr:orotidine 5'-phosphate decarboxylase [Alphaproteobacteria bacterium]